MGGFEKVNFTCVFNVCKLFGKKYDYLFSLPVFAFQSPETGSFVFSLACTSACELWLSGDEVEANMTRMVKLEPWESTDYQQWEKYDFLSTEAE